LKLQLILGSPFHPAEGLLPVTDSNGVPISTIKKQGGDDWLFVTFEAPAGGMW
jgi:hypothetical protein